MEPNLGGMSASPSHSFVLIFLFLSPVSWTLGCLIQQQRGRSSRARRRGLSVEHEVQEGYTGVRLPLSGIRSPSASFSHTSPRLLTGGFFHDKRGALPTNPCFAHPSLSSSSSSPSSLHAHCEFTVLASTSTTSIHKHMFVRCRRRTCGAGVEWNPSTAEGLSVWGQAGYHVHLNKGPVFRRASRESSTAPLLWPALL